MNKKTVYFTICSANYLAYAKSLFESLQVADASAAASFRVVLADGQLERAVADTLPFDVLYAEELGIAHFWDMAMRYSIMEFNTAIKPSAFLHFFEEGATEVVYLDPDILVLRELSHVHRLLDGGASMVLTPHSTEPLDDGYDPDDIRLLRTGTYNLGFLACRSSDEVEGYLRWWHSHMLENCIVDLENGLFVDQKFMDLAPSYLADVAILRHKGYNAAYWNLSSRTVSRDDTGWHAGGEPLHFFHFSGVIPGRSDVFSKHQNRFGRNDIGSLSELLDHYLQRIDANEHGSLSEIPYAFGRFDSGERIPDIYRRVYREINRPAEVSRDATFSEDEDIMSGPAAEIRGSNGLLTRIMHRIWTERPDLQKSFPITDPQGLRAFATWFVHSAKREYDLPSAAIDPVASRLETSSQPTGSLRPLSLRWWAGRIMDGSPGLRPLYRYLPTPVRTKAREFLVRKAAGHDGKGALITSKRRLNPDLKPGFGIYGHFTAVSGVGEGARRMVLAAEHADLDYSTHIISTNGSANEMLPAPRNATAEASPYNCLIFHINADHIPMVLDDLPAEHLEGRYRIGYWAWELEVFPAEWNRAFDYLDEIWVPSTFVQKAVQAKTSKPVCVVPHPVWERPDSGETRRQFGLPADRYLFFCAFDLNSYLVRKNPMAAYKAFARAFPGKNSNEGPMLVVKMHGRSQGNPEHADLLLALSNDPRVAIIDMPLSVERYTALQRICDAFVSLHRSEGFGMNLVEFMHLGKPVIATDYSGNTDYLTADNAYPVQYQLVSVPVDAYPGGAGQRWADPDIECAAKQLQRVYKDRDEATAIASFGQKTVESRYSIFEIARLIKCHFNRVQSVRFTSHSSGK